MDTQKIGKFLKELRKQSNMTQEQLGEKIGVTNKTISKWENGNYMPPIENWYKDKRYTGWFLEQWNNRTLFGFGIESFLLGMVKEVFLQMYRFCLQMI